MRFWPPAGIEENDPPPPPNSPSSDEMIGSLMKNMTAKDGSFLEGAPGNANPMPLIEIQ